MIRIYIAEDEPLAARKLQTFVMRLSPDAEVSLFSDGLSALMAIGELEPDILFLDIEMPNLRGVDLLQRIDQKRRMEIIVTTAFEQYALASFEFSVTDYLLKPYSFERLSQAMQKAREHLRLKDLDHEEPAESDAMTISIRTDLHTEIVRVSDIYCVEALKDYVRIVVNEKRMLTLGTLSNYEDLLPHQLFVRIHRSTIINAQRILSYNKDSVTLTNGNSYNIGKKYKESFENTIKKRH